LENEIVNQFGQLVSGDLILGNTLVQWIAAAVIFVSVFIPLMALKLFSKKVYRKHKTEYEDQITAKVFLFSNLAKINFFVTIGIALFPAIESLSMPASMDVAAKYLFIVSIFVQILIWANNTLNLYGLIYLQKNPTAQTSMNVFSLMWKVITFALIIVVMLDQLGFNITALIAGLGVGGIAIAFALQNVLSDVFGSLAIILDKPFKVGDYIQVGSFEGTVENVGLKTTRVRSSWGELLIFSNNELIKSTIQNFGEVQERRISLMVGVTYETPHEKLLKIPEIIRTAVFSQKGTSIGHVTLKQLAESSLNFQVWYFIQEIESIKWREIEHNINLEIVRLLEKNGISFAYPTRTVYTKNF
jgi:small-conductance mechanosensitive channel